MSSVRTHFWTDVARFHGGGCSPRKYGLNGTIPALTSSRVGSAAISDADGTTLWSRAAKWSRNLRWISSERMDLLFRRLVEAQSGYQLVLALGHPLADL